MKLPSSNFPVWVCEGWDLRSVNICKLEKLKDRTWTAIARTGRF